MIIEHSSRLPLDTSLLISATPNIPGAHMYIGMGPGPAGSGSHATAHGESSPIPKEQYDQMVSLYRRRRLTTALDPALFNQWRQKIAHPEDDAVITQEAIRLSRKFITGLPGVMNGMLAARHDDTRYFQYYPSDHFAMGEAMAVASVQYYLMRDLWGPLFNDFADDLEFLVREELFPKTVVSMYRDGEALGATYRKRHHSVIEAFITRGTWMNSDAFNPSARIEATKEHVGLLAKYLFQKGITWEKAIGIIDSGAWGTLAVEIHLLRSFLSFISTNQLSQTLKDLPIDRRLQHALDALPSAMKNAVELYTDPDSNTTDSPQRQRRKMLWGAVIQDDKLLDKLKGQTLETYVLFAYSHHDDLRFTSPKNPIPGWLNVINDNILSPEALEMIFDSLEEAFVSRWNSPASLHLQPNGEVDAILNTQMSFATELAGRAGRLAVDHATRIHKWRQDKGITIPPLDRLMLMVELSRDAEKTYTGMLPSHTPTWEHGERFLKTIWPAMTDFEGSTYRTLNLRRHNLPSHEQTKEFL